MSEITVNTQSSIMIKDGGRTIYFDPLSVSGGDAADVIFITHDHYDHFSPDDIKKILKDNTIIVVPEKMTDTAAAKLGISADRFVSVKPDNSYEAGGVKFETVLSYNRMKPFHLKSAGWCGYVVTLSDGRYYVMGDTDFTLESGKVKCDVLLLPVGGTYTMNTKQAAECALALKPKVAIPTHYGSIVGEKEDGDEFKRLVNEADSSIEVKIML